MSLSTWAIGSRPFPVHPNVPQHSVDAPSVSTMWSAVGHPCAWYCWRSVCAAVQLTDSMPSMTTHSALRADVACCAHARTHRYAVEEVGSDRILFGTDTPLYFSPMQRARIDYAQISDADRANILRNTAASILNLEPAASSL